MDVVKFKKTGDVYFVQYEENEDIKTLKTEDEPESGLSVAMDNTALAALKLFKISDVGCKLQAIEWKDGEKAGSKCILLSGESQFGQFKMALPKYRPRTRRRRRKEFTIRGKQRTSTTRPRRPSAPRQSGLPRARGGSGPSPSMTKKRRKGRRNAGVLSARWRIRLAHYSRIETDDDSGNRRGALFH
jgi:hypothetical protein